MALTPFDSSNNTAVQQDIYARKAFLWAVKHNFFAQFVGKQVANVNSRTGKKNDRPAYQLTGYPSSRSG